MILAAGRGTRLGALGRVVPKVLVDVGGEPLLARHLRQLEAQGVRRVVVNGHHLVERLRAWVAGYAGPLELVCVEEPELLGTAGGVRHALEHLLPGPFLVVYGDILLDEPLAALVAAHERHRAAATIAVHAADDVEGKGVVELDEDDRVTRFVEKPEAAMDGPAWINSGVYLLEASFVSGLPLGVELDFGREVLPDAVARGEHVRAARLERPVLDLGTPGALALARQLAS
jgi:mannose-1-phosphate guanylyltransferase